MPSGQDIAVARSVEVRRHDESGSVGLVLEHDDGHVVAILTPREADHLAGRMRKAANDLRSAEARRT